MTNNLCTQCGASLQGTASFCTKCGAQVKQGPQSRQKTSSTKRLRAKNASRNKARNTYLWIGGAAVALALIGFAIIASSQPTQANLPYPEVERISVKAAYDRHQSGDAIFLDVRDRDSYIGMRIDGAVLIPLTEVEARRGELPQDAEIITYCT